MDVHRATTDARVGRLRFDRGLATAQFDFHVLEPLTESSKIFADSIVTIEEILQELGQAFARERVAGIFKESVAHIGVYTDDFKQMTVAIAGNG